jgi:hypothetical protein
MRKDYLLLRQVLGLLGLLLPALVLFFGLIGDNKPQWFYSISATYYANSGPLFIMLMGAVGVFLLTYGGGGYADLADKVLNRLAGSFALLIIAFPCRVPGVDRAGVFNLPINVSHIIHSIAAALFFGALAVNIIWRFTQTEKPAYKSRYKVMRDRLYKICGGGILVFMAFQGVSALFIRIGWLTMVNEAVMLLLFGIAWLVKGESIGLLNDRRRKAKGEK